MINKSTISRCLGLVSALLLSLLLTTAAVAAEAKSPFKAFTPNEPLIRIKEIKPGMKGTARTVIRGTAVVSFPIEVLEILPQNGSPRNLILIRASGAVIEESGGVAAGMSGSPVYIDGRLAGAIGYGWSFSRHDMALVTPIEDMMDIWQNPERIPSFSLAPQVPDAPPAAEPKSRDKGPAATQSNDQRTISSADIGPVEKREIPSVDIPPIPSMDASPLERGGVLFVQGVSQRMSEEIGTLLGRKTVPFAMGSQGREKKVAYNRQTKPGDAVAAAIAWGDVEISALGTMSAIDRDGRFVAFAHPFAELGTTSAALLEASVARVVPGVESPMKIGTTGDIIGIVTQDRPQGVGGRLGTFAPAAGVRINFTDVDAGRRMSRSFQMMIDPYQMSGISAAAITGCIENLWGRRGGGSAKVSTHYSGAKIMDKWSRTNIFVSEQDVTREMMKEFALMTQIFAVNQFQELRPFGIDVMVEVTQDPRVLYVEDVQLPEGPFHPGQSVSFDITLRPWRKAPFKRTYALTIPQEVSGICELLVRGGGIQEENAEYLEAGWRSISSLPILLSELDAKESNDQLVLEIRGQESFEAQINKARNAKPEDLINDKLKSEIRAEKMKEGSMRIVRTNYYVDGVIHRLIKVDPGASAQEGPDELEGEAE